MRASWPAYVARWGRQPPTAFADDRSRDHVSSAESDQTLDCDTANVPGAPPARVAFACHAEARNKPYPLPEKPRCTSYPRRRPWLENVVILPRFASKHVKTLRIAKTANHAKILQTQALRAIRPGPILVSQAGRRGFESLRPLFGRRCQTMPPAVVSAFLAGLSVRFRLPFTTSLAAIR